MKTRTRGFTLLELMLVVVLAGLLLGLGVPAMGNFIRNARMTSAANDMLAALHLARSEAIKRKGAVTVCASSNPAAADEDDVACVASRLLNDSNGWIVFVDDNINGVREAGELLVQQHDALPGAIVARSSQSPFRVTYLETGFPGTFTDVDGDGKRDLVADNEILDADGNPTGSYEDYDGDGKVDVVEPLVRGAAFNLVFCDKRGNDASAGELSAARGIAIEATGRPLVTRIPGEIADLLAENSGGPIAGCT